MRKFLLFLLLGVGSWIGYGFLTDWIETRPVYYRVKIDFESRGQFGILDAYVKCTPHTSRPLGGAQNIGFTATPLLYGVRLPDSAGVLNQIGEETTCLWAWWRTHKWPHVHPDDRHAGLEQTGIPRLIWLRDYVLKDYAEIYYGTESYDQVGANVRPVRASVTLARSSDYESWLSYARESPDRFLYDQDNTLTAYPAVAKDRFPHAACFADVLVPPKIWQNDENLRNWIKNIPNGSLSVVPDHIFDLKGDGFKPHY